MDYPKEKIPLLYSIGRKIRHFRIAKNITQAELAKVIYVSPTVISNVELGLSEYTDEQLEDIKEYLNIVGMPLSEHDCIAFKKRLYIWRDIIRDRFMAEAKEMHSNMSAVVNLDPCDRDLPVLYRLFEVMLFLYDKNIDAAKEKLNYFEKIRDRMTPEHLHYYYCNMGLLNIYSAQYEDALGFYTKALELRNQHEDAYTEDDARLYYELAVCYTYLERLISATAFLSKVYEMGTETMTQGLKRGLDNVRAINYMKLGRFEEAKELLDRCLIVVKSMVNKPFIGGTLQNLGLLNRYLKNHKAAIEYFDQALNIQQIGSTSYLWASYHKIHCLIETKKLPKAEELIERAKNLYGANEDALILFESLKHLIIISKRFSLYRNEESTEYIENVTIPFLIKQHDYFIAISYYEFLEKHYEKIKRQRKSLLASKGIRDIYKIIYR